MALKFPSFGKKRPEEPQSAEDVLVKQIDNMQRISDERREKFYGSAWEKDVEDFYSLTYNKGMAPSFRPRVCIPKLQALMMSEASDLSESSPKIYIAKKDDRDKEREKALQAHWEDDNYNIEIMYAELWSLFAGNGYMMVGYDPDYDDGEGRVWAKQIDPRLVHPDPNADDDNDLGFVIIEKPMYLDEIQRRWPEQGSRVRPRAPGAPLLDNTTLNFPPGPMRAIGGMPNEINQGDSRLTVRYVFTRDYSVGEVVRPKDSPEPDPKAPVAPLKYKPLYPYGRMIVECERIILYDAANPYPNGMFPIVRFPGLPAMTEYFAPPAVNLTKGLQELAEKMYTQTFENAVRLNNGVTFIDDGSGIDIDEYGGIPAEVHTVAQGSRYPETKWPSAMPQHMTQLPESLFKMQEEVQGFTPSRRGQSPAGNVSAPLHDSTIAQSQALTRLRGRLVAQSIQRLANLVFFTMAEFYRKEGKTFPVYDGPQGYENIPWVPIEDYSDYNVRVDPGSIRPYSAATLRTMVPLLKREHLIDDQHAIEMLDLPDQAEILKNLEREKQLAAAAGLQKKAGGGKK